jgi:xylan 1,4-beta-xylosidase
VVKERVGEETRIPFSIKIPKNLEGKAITLRIDTNYLQREFRYGFIGLADTLLGKLEHVNYLCDEGYDKGKRFTGAMAGIYAVSEAHKEIAWGDFYYFINEEML